MQKIYYPEGFLFDTLQNQKCISTITGLYTSMEQGCILEAKATVFDKNKNLIVNLGSIKGVIPFEEASLGETKEIALISRIGKPVCFKVKRIKEQEGKPLALLSRKEAQYDCMTYYIRALSPGDIINCKITHIEKFGCFADIGCGITALLPIDNISISRISSPYDRFFRGQQIKCVVRSIDESNRVLLSHKELLGTWQENAAYFTAGETVTGIIRSIEDYGVFVELAPNLAGLAESCSGIKVGMTASVYIKSIIPDRMKIKLVIIDAFETSDPPALPHYFINDDHIDKFTYSPPSCTRVVETYF